MAQATKSSPWSPRKREAAIKKFLKKIQEMEARENGMLEEYRGKYYSLGSIGYELASAEEKAKAEGKA